MSEIEETQPVKKTTRQIQAEALVRKLGVEGAVEAVRTARRFNGAGEKDEFNVSEVQALLALERVHVTADALAEAIKASVAGLLG